MKEFFPSSTRICCQNGTYSTNFYEKQRQVSLEKTRHSETSVLQITATDFELRRFISTKAVKIVMPADSSSGASIEVLLCSDGSILVNHVRTEKENSLDNHVCFSRGMCAHIYNMIKSKYDCI
uniref:Uncharacterized protein n=1 Tax=Meloidogyne enterolobii TaxID=390850 RepID=A0A6V7UQN0_MELEN|nr:unnamed protein product [Meloidogyne enterolobii]